MAGYPIMCEISKKTAELIEEGLAYISGDGVRDPKTKRYIEKFKLVIQDPSDPKNIVKDTVSVIKTIKTKKANTQRVIDVAFKNQQMLQQILPKLATSVSLGWVGIVVNLVNTGVSVVGFYATLKKMDSAEGEIRKFFDQYKNDRENDRVERFHNLLDGLTLQLDYLRKRYDYEGFEETHFIQREQDIERDLIQTENFLRTVIKDFIDGRIEHTLGCRIVYTLSPVFAETVNEYCCQYHQAHGVSHSMFTKWGSLLDEINGEAFRRKLKEDLIFCMDYIRVPPQEKKRVLDVTEVSICQLKDNLIFCHDAIEKAAVHMLVKPEELLNQEAYDTLDKQAQESVGVPLDDLITRQLNRMAINEEGETVQIPLNALGAWA